MQSLVEKRYIFLLFDCHQLSGCYAYTENEYFSKILDFFFNEMLFRDLIHRNKEHILLSQYMKTGVPNYYYYLCVAEVYVQFRIFYKIDKTFHLYTSDQKYCGQTYICTKKR